MTALLIDSLSWFFIIVILYFLVEKPIKLNFSYSEIYTRLEKHQLSS